MLTSTFPRWRGDKEPPFVFELSKRLTDEFDVTVLAPHAPGAMLAEQFDGIEVRRFRYAPDRWQVLAYNGGILANLKKKRLNYLLIPFFVLAQFFAAARMLRSGRFEVIHAHWIIPQGLIALAARFFSRSQARIVCTSHGGDLFGLSGRLLTRLKATLIRGFDAFTVVSHAMHEYAYTLSGRSDIHVIPMGVDLVNAFTPGGGDRETESLLFAGRLVEKKGVNYLIRAIPKVLERFPQTQLTVAGDGPDADSLKRLAASIDVEDHVRFIGAVNQTMLCDLYRRTAIFVAPSIVARGGDQEGLGLVFVEALGCECPVIASDLPGISDVITDGITGRICRQKDESDLANRIIELLADNNQRLALGRRGRRHVLERFDWSISVQRYKQLFEGAVAKRPSVPNLRVGRKRI